MSTEIYYLSDYNWERGRLLSEGTKNFKVDTHRGIRYIPKDKCAKPGEQICIVWDQTMGSNGRGGYYVERGLYPEHRIPAELVARQTDGPHRGRVSIRVDGSFSPLGF